MTRDWAHDVALPCETELMPVECRQLRQEVGNSNISAGMLATAQIT